MAKTQLRITAVSVAQDGTLSLDNSQRFSAMLNPSEMKLNRGISYNRRRVQGQLGTEAKFAGVKPDDLSFALVIDSTGAVPTSQAGDSTTPVSVRLEDLKNIVFNYQGGIHEPRHVCVVW